MIFDKEIALKVYSGKFWSMTHIFFNTVFIYTYMQVIVESLRKMALLFNGQISDLSSIL